MSRADFLERLHELFVPDMVLNEPYDVESLLEQLSTSTVPTAGISTIAKRFRESVTREEDSVEEHVKNYKVDADGQ